MTKEGIKAIRFVNGYKTNLSIKLPTNSANPTVFETKLTNFLLDHIIDIYGVDIYDKLQIKFNPQPGADAADYAVLYKFASDEAVKICLGQAD